MWYQRSESKGKESRTTKQKTNFFNFLDSVDLITDQFILYAACFMLRYTH